MFLPYSSEVDDGRIRMAALGIVLTCLVGFLATWPQHQRLADQAQQIAYQQAEQRLLGLPDTNDSEDSSYSEAPYADAERMLEALQEDPAIRQAAMKKTVDSVLSASPIFRFGFTASHPSLLGLFLHMFLHAGWLHLIGNLVFFYVCGVAMEKHWGLWRFLGIYVGGGVFAAIFFGVFSRVFAGHAPVVPLVGASGAIAATMGGFLAIYPHKKIKIFYMFGLRPRSFMIPALLYLPFWFGLELFQAVMTAGAPGGGTAYAAHVGGFVFGFLAAKFIRGEQQEFEEGVQRMHDLAVAAVAAGIAPTPQPPRADIVMAWESLEQGSPEEAKAAFTRQFDRWTQQGAPAMQDLSEHLDRIFRTARSLRFEPLRYFDWGMALARNNHRRVALGCLEMAMSKTDALPPMLRAKCRIQAADLYDALGLRPERAAQLRTKE